MYCIVLYRYRGESNYAISCIISHIRRDIGWKSRFLGELYYVAFTLSHWPSVCRLSVTLLRPTQRVDGNMFLHHLIAWGLLGTRQSVLKFWGENPRGYWWSCKLNGSVVWKIGIFDRYLALFWKRYQTRMTNKNSYEVYRMVPFPMTSSDP